MASRKIKYGVYVDKYRITKGFNLDLNNSCFICFNLKIKY